MAYDVLITDSAAHDIEDIANYIAIELANPIAASKFFDSMNAVIVTLRDNPLIFPLHSDPGLRRKSYRCAGVMNYLVVFRVLEEKQCVYILRLFHQTQNYPEYL